MKHRRWVLVVFALLFLSIAGVYLTLRLTRMNERVKQIILAQVHPYTAPGASIGSLRFDIFNLHLRDVALTAKDSSFSVEVKDLRFSYNPLRLLRSDFSPSRVARDVLMVEPNLIIHDVRARITETPSITEDEPLKPLITAFSSIRQITVQRGAVWAENKRKMRILLSQNLTGWFQGVSPDSAELRFTGRLFESPEDNLEMTGYFDLHAGKVLALEAQLLESQPSPELPIFLPEFVRVTKGRMKGQASYSRDRSATGFFELMDGSFALQDSALQYDHISLRTELAGRHMTLKGKVGDFNGASFDLSGSIQNILNPILLIEADCPSMDITEFIKRTAPDLRIPIAGHGGFQFSLTGSIDSLRCDGRVFSDSLFVGGILFESLNSNLSIAGNLFEMRGSARHHEGATLELETQMDVSELRDPVISGSVVLTGPFHPILPAQLRRPENRIDGVLAAEIEGPFSNPNAWLSGEVTLNSEKNRSIWFRPEFVYADHHLSGELTSSEVFGLTATAERILTHDFSWQVQCFQFQSLLNYLAPEGIAESSERFEGFAQIEANSKNWQARLRGVRRSDRGSVFDVGIQATRDPKQQNGIVNGAVYDSAGDSLPLSAAFHYQDGQLDVTDGRIDDFFHAEFSFPFRQDEPISGSVRLEQLELSRLHAYARALNPANGQVSGRVAFGGTIADPLWDFQLTLSDGALYQRGTYEGAFNGRLDMSGLSTLSGDLNRNDIPILKVSVDRSHPDSLQGRIYGDNLFLGKDQIRLTRSGESVQGDARFDLRVSGRPRSPIIAGEVQIRDGRLAGIQFHNLIAQITDTPDSAGNRFLVIDSAELTRLDGFKLNLNGQIPHADNQDADLDVLADGNLLGLLTDLTKVVGKAQSQGSMDLRIGGRPGAWVLGEGNIQLDSGTLDMEVFIDKLDKLKGHLAFDPETRFVHIDSLLGTVEKRAVSFSNIPSQNGYAPLVFESAGLSLGVIRIHTDPEGIPVVIPGLMESGEAGNMQLANGETTEPFVIAGPVSNPLLSGTLRLSDFRFTYPVLDMDAGQNPSAILAGLAKINWQVRVEPQNDVHYIRNIESPVGNIYLDLQLRDRFGGLNFSGIEDEDNLQVWGNLVSTEGTLEALDHYFRPEQITFDFPRGMENPILSGRASTTVIDSVGLGSTVWLILSNLNESTPSEGGDYLDQISLHFETDNPNLGRNEADLLAALGYSGAQMMDRAYDAIGLQVENLVFRPLFRPIEKQIRRRLGLDVVRVSSMFSRNLLQIRDQDTETFELDPKWLLRSTRLTLGKYVAPGFFLTYTGQVQNDMGVQYQLHGLGFRHALSLEYSLRPDLFLEMEYTYDSQLLSDRREDKKIWLRHIFPF